MQRILETLRGFEGVLELAPREGSTFPAAAWGDHFFYYAPEGEVPANAQPYATIVTKDYPGDAESELDRAGRWRVNIHAGRAEFTRLLGEQPRAVTPREHSAADVLHPHPVYGRLGWVAVVNPGERTGAAVLALLHAAHEAAKRRSRSHH